MKADYDSPSFSCMVSLPVSLMMREQAAWFHLTAKFPQLLLPEIKASAEQITNLKDVWKFAFTETMALKLGKQFEFNSSPFQVTVNVCYKDDESECACLSVRTSFFIITMLQSYLICILFSPGLKCALKSLSTGTSKLEFSGRESLLEMPFRVSSLKSAARNSSSTMSSRCLKPVLPTAMSNAPTIPSMLPVFI